MNIFGVLSMLGGLALFLYGMHTMGEGLTKIPGQKACRVIVPDDQLSLAIGKEGQNARLAARLCGNYKIDIKSAAGSLSWCFSYCCDTIFLCHYCYGGGFCEFRNYEIVTGHWNHHGSQYWNHYYILDFKFVRN